jgi:hypothetical protein
MLCHENCIFMNGEAHPVDEPLYALLRQLADSRSLGNLADCGAELAEILYEWYLDGYLLIDKN